ncbi:uncharacterized protein B0P05DRAFT_535629 [Gilbertella persicaria]|uniref:uncharacterized protein n=1 Tax=Gilbertella persicaria TaxID=101096 RepID=UPI00221EB2A6|nr:uncharacterized protein B0P05DRAFT_535629 [Gilbertella persicaria]KAI8083964.1 hypothetical protein B0P05DRAFT_535629 [Gilbertella persicaria]
MILKSIVLFSLLTNLISAQQASDHRAYFSTILQNKHAYIIGGSGTSLQVPILNYTNGIDVNKPEWLSRTGPLANSSILKPFERGVAFMGYNQQVFVQGGNGTSTEMEHMMRYSPLTDGWDIPYQIAADRPAPAYMMTATVNANTHVAYYYGGQPLNSNSSATADFTRFDTATGVWSKITPNYPNAYRPGRFAHSASMINNQLFILGGITYPNTSMTKVQADFASVLVYDIQTNTAAAIATLGDIPEQRQLFSTALGLDGRSIVIYGGAVYTDTNEHIPASNDVYVLDTCTLTWTKKSVGGNAPGSLYAHGAININNYMVLLMGKTDTDNYNERLYILDLNQWKWVNQFEATDDTVAAGSCQFNLPNFNKTSFSSFQYDMSVLDNPYRPQNDSKKSTGLGVGFGLLGGLLIVSGVWWYRRRIRKKTRTANPRWTSNRDHERGYPLFEYNKQEADHPVSTYTASDHEQWEANPPQDIWRRMEGLNKK